MISAKPSITTSFRYHCVSRQLSSFAPYREMSIVSSQLQFAPMSGAGRAFAIVFSGIIRGELSPEVCRREKRQVRRDMSRLQRLNRKRDDHQQSPLCLRRHNVIVYFLIIMLEMATALRRESACRCYLYVMKRPRRRHHAAQCTAQRVANVGSASTAGIACDWPRREEVRGLQR